NAVADDRTNTVFVTAPTESLKLIETILKDLDSNPMPATELRAFQLKAAGAEATSKLLSTLVKGDDGNSRRGFDDFPFFSRSSSSGDAAKPKVNITFDERTNTVIVSASAEVIRQVEDLLKLLDANPASSSVVKVFQLKYADAFTTARLVRETFAPENKGSGDSPFRFLIFGNPGEQQKGAKVTVSEDSRTNSIVVTGPTELMKVIQELIDKIDANPVAEEAMFIYRLRNGQAVRLEIVLNTLFGNYDSQGGQNNRNGGDQEGPQQQFRQSGLNRNNGQNGGNNSGRNNNNNRGSAGGNRGRQNGANGQVSPGLAKALTEMAGQVFVVADQDTNALLVTTATKYQDRVRQIIAELDRPVPQVLIKVLVAEVTHDDSVDFGVDFSVINRRPNGEGTSVSSAFGNAAQTGGLVVSLLEDKLNVQLHALRTQGKLDVLSRPYILASDNQLASITVGNRVPFITNTRVTDNGQTLNDIAYEDIGILLNVTPHINPDGIVLMDVTPEVSQLTSSTVPIGNGQNGVVIAKRSADSRVGVRSGQTIVIGGLMEDRKTSTVNKIPLLGDLPLVGPIFARTVVTKAKTELLFFLTPHVAQSPDLLPDAAAQEEQGLRITPNAVTPGKYEEHRRGLERGRMPFTQPVGADQAIQPIGPPAPPPEPMQPPVAPPEPPGGRREPG
ncbi:MAG: hypothetical protein JWO31_2269, partial [Phycisphaerales bacterium]|nr:hypothetical protein [Phycisphaerales bacterium]